MFLLVFILLLYEPLPALFSACGKLAYFHHVLMLAFTDEVTSKEHERQLLMEREAEPFSEMRQAALRTLALARHAAVVSVSRRTCRMFRLRRASV